MSSIAPRAMPVAPKPPVQILQTDSIDRFRTSVNESFVPLHIDCRAASSFHGSLRAAGSHGVSLTDLCAAPHVVTRTDELIARSPRPAYKVSIMLSGSGLLIQDGRETLLREGDLAIYDTSRPYTLGFEHDLRTMVLMFPHEALSLPSALVTQLTAVRISSDTGLGAIVTPFLTRLGVHLEDFAGASGARLARSAIDLVATLLTQELGLQSPTGPHAALRRRVCAFIDAHLGEPDLNPQTIATAHYVSLRHLHDVFHETGSTVSGTIRARRLERCRDDLLDVASAHISVASVGARWGFPDAAHFSRTFKSAYGLSPSAYRPSAHG